MLRAIGRFIVVAFGFAAATLVAGFILVTLGLEAFVQETAGNASFDGDTPLGEGLAWLERISMQAAFIGTMASAMTLVPAVLVVVAGEVAGIRSAVYYVLAGGAALACIPLLNTVMAEAGATLPAPQMFQVLATAGFGGGLVYWFIAGRGAQ